MAKFTKNPEVVEAVKWSKIDDHADINMLSISVSKGKELCASCGQPLSAHGMRCIGVSMSDWICPGRWIITHEDNQIEYLDDTTFQARYSPLKE